jgi:hypothetical protein
MKPARRLQLRRELHAAMRLRKRREKAFGQTNARPLDRNAKVRIQRAAEAYGARFREGRQHHRGPLTRAFLGVLATLLWGFHNGRTGCCIPSYERIAERAQCARSTVAEALKALEFAGILTWHHRVTRVRERCRDLFGNNGWRWRVVRTSNAYAFHDPGAGRGAPNSSKSDFPAGTLNQGIQDFSLAPNPDPNSPLERALGRLRSAWDAKEAAVERGNGLAPA